MTSFYIYRCVYFFTRHIYAMNQTFIFSLKNTNNTNCFMQYA